MSDNFFTVGPFKESKKRVEGFSRYMYYNIYYNKTLVKLLELEDEKNLAIKNDDKEKTDEIKQQIMVYETMILLAGSMTSSGSANSLTEDATYD
tara:strand:- start:341 stop:622 length:282 start_codon:yes stop_codon:yes gene_type:complete